MNTFVLRALGFLGVQVAVFLLLWRPAMPEQRNMLAATLDKHRRLAETPGPRIVLSGGSNVPFGIQSPLLESLTGMRVVNLGLAAGLGGPFMMNELSAAAQPGDLLVLCLEYDLYDGPGHALALRQVLEFRPAAWFHIPVEFQKRVWDEEALGVIGAWVRRSWSGSAGTDSFLPADAWYPRDGFNAWGDYTRHYGFPSSLAALPPEDPVFNPRIAPALAPATGERLAAAVRRSATRGARFVVSWPPVPREVFERRHAAIEGLAREVAAVPGLGIVGEPGDFAFEREAFFDLTYHLNEEGARRRTDLLATRLRAAGLLSR